MKLMNTLITLWIIIALILLGGMAQGQDSAKVEEQIPNDAAFNNREIKPFQMSMIAPMGTNGMESGKIANRVSLNVFAGYNGGVEGVEVGGCLNVLNGHLKGAQFAGFGNTVLGQTQGAQFAGFYNFNRQYTQGAQFAGFTNIVVDSMQAGQFAGFANYTQGASIGLQAAGFANVLTGSLTGTQLAGFSNVAAGNLTGGQAAGFANVAKGNVKGGQIAGFANVATGSVTGAQISGFLNVAKHVKGAQIGLINVCDSINGVPIGLLSIVRNGYNKLEVGGNESFYGTMQAKLGSKRFYNIVGVGASPKNGDWLWGFGYGIGSAVALNEKMDINLDATCWQVNEGEWLTDELNLLNKLQLGLSYAFAESFAVYGGPSFNVVVSNRQSPEGNNIGSAIAPWQTWTEDSNETRVIMYPGFQLGVRL